MRKGYDENFLGPGNTIKLPVAGDKLKQDVLYPNGFSDGVVPYINYSLMMSKKTKQALYSAANVDLEKMIKTPKGEGRDWFYDDRIGKENVVTNYAYSGTQWDRGHLTRRTAVTWGDSVDFVTQASNDSCSYANASMQHKKFNEDEWRAVELLVSKFELATKLTVITGPIFTITDRFFIRKYDDEPVRIPSAFWKIITYVDSKSGKLSTQAYIFFQDKPQLKDSRGKARIRMMNLQVTTTELETWTGLKFDKKMFESNPLKFYDGPESISTKVHRALLNKDPDMLTLDEGLIEEKSLAEARDKIPLDEFYELVQEISWI